MRAPAGATIPAPAGRAHALKIFLTAAPRGPVGAVIGIIGGGQLGRMLAEAASSSESLAGRISRTVVLDPTPGCPAAQAGAGQIVAGFRDSAAIRELASRADIITYEIESGDADVLESIQGETQVSPLPSTLRIIQDKLLQKSFLRDRGIAVADFAGVEGRGQLDEALARFGCPAILKARRDGYDGRGNYRIGSPDAAGAAAGHFGDRPVMVERAVDFGMEVSVIAARNTRGRVATYPAVENMHGEGILRTTVAPARAPREVLDEAAAVARRTIEVLDGAGVFGIEMFVERSGRVLVNEIAPRVHNSGHHTLVSSETSQFEQHLRAVLGMELGPTRLLRPAVMCNILGPDGFEGPYSLAGAPPAGGGAHLKMYGKAVSKPSRKLGHLTLVGGDMDAAGGAPGVDALLERALAAHGAVRIEPAPGEGGGDAGGGHGGGGGSQP